MGMFFDGLFSLLEDLVGSFYGFAMEPDDEPLDFEGPRVGYLEGHKNA